MVEATWNGAVLARSDATVVVEGNHYFPAGSVNMQWLRENAQHTECPWKGTASYYDIEVDGQANAGAAWTYPTPKPAAQSIRGYVAFWKGVTISNGPTDAVSR